MDENNLLQKQINKQQRKYFILDKIKGHVKQELKSGQLRSWSVYVTMDTLTLLIFDAFF